MSPRLLVFFSPLFALCTLNFELSAQYYSLGTDPASVRWSQVKTEHFRVIFPSSLDSQAIRTANALEYFRPHGSASLDSKTSKWPVILHTRTVVSNATTPYAPKRIDMLTTPPQDNYGQDWMDQLVIHEFRHSAQYASLNKGFTKAMTFLFGQQALPAVMGLFVPFWFIEGDAVALETATTNTGRGRVPAFEMKLRAQFLEKGIYSYDKAYNGSYRDFTPGWYELGYQLAGQTRIKYGKETWARVMKKTGIIPFMFVPFSNTLYKETGFGKSRLYRSISADIKEEWMADDQSMEVTDYTIIKRSPEKYYTDYKQPSAYGTSQIIARRSSIDDITRIVSIDSGGIEKIVVTPGTMIDEGLSVAGDKICWAELDRDPRWELRDYSVIILHNLQSGTTRQITKKTRYFSPALSPDGSRIAAVEVDGSNRNFIVIMETLNGTALYRFPTPENHFAAYPAWSADGKQLAMILIRSEGKSINVLNVENGKFKTVLPFSYTEISKPTWFGDHILFTGAYTGKDNIFALDTASHQFFQVTSARFGATDAEVSPDGKKLYYSNYTANGYEIVSTTPEPWNIGTLEPWNIKDNHYFILADKLAEQEDFIFKPEEIPDSSYKIKPYRKGLNLFNFHSWAPVSLDVNNTDMNPGVTLLSQNLLGTSYTTLGYEYNLNEETGKYFLKYSYTGLYPVFDVDMDYGLRRGNLNDSAHGQVNYHYDELNLGGWASLPLNWNARSWFVGIQPYLGYSYKLLKMNPGQELKFRKDRYNSLNSIFFFYAQSRISERDLNPRWMQKLQVSYRRSVVENDTISSIFASELNLCFPGLFRHHSLVLYGAYQKRLVDEFNYHYSDFISFPSGFSGINSNNIFSGAVTYALPLFYPDWNIGPVIYIKRFKAAFFYDYAVDFGTAANQLYQSTGIDLTIDFHLFRHFAPLAAGIRTVWLPESRTIGLEFLYSIDLSY